MWGRRETLIAPSVLMVLAFALFANTFGSDWTYDDFPVIVDNPDVRSLWAFFQDTYPSRPLRELTYLLDHFFFGFAPAGWHIQNIFWHGLNAALLFLLVRRLDGERVVAWFASLLFLVHPLQVEVVANISHRKDSLALAFCLLALHVWLRAVGGGRRAPWLLLSLALWGVALLAKQNAVALPVVALAIEAVFLPPESRMLLRSKRVVAVGTVLTAVAVSVKLAGAASSFAGQARALLEKWGHYDGGVPGTYFAMVLKSWAFMLSKVFWPHDLAVEYLYPIPGSFADPWLLAGLTAALLLLFGAWFFYGRSPLAFVSLVWLGVFWLPTSNLWPTAYFAADRYLYAPSVGIFILLGMGIARLIRPPVLCWGAVMLLAGVLSFLTWQQNQVWRTDETLYLHALKVSPQSAFLCNELGMYYDRQGDVRRAVEYFSRGERANPRQASIQYNLGSLYERMGLRQKALAHYAKFLQLDSPAYRDEAAELKARLGRESGLKAD